MTTRSYAQTSNYGSHTKHLSDYLRVVYKRRWLAGAAFLAVFTFGAVNTLKETPLYEARTQILIEKDARRATSLDTVLDNQNGYYDDDFYPTQLRILKSRRLAARVVDKLGLGRDVKPVAATAGTGGRSLGGTIVGWVGDLLGAPKRIDPPAADETTAQQGLISGFMGGLDVQPVRTTRIFEIVYRSADPVFAEQAANAVANEYIAQTKDIRGEATQESSDFLKTQLDAQRQKLYESDLKLNQYKSSHDAVGLDDKVNTTSTKLAEISAQLTKAQIETIDKEAAYQGLKAVQGDREKLAANPVILANPEIHRFKAELSAALAEREKRIAAGAGAKTRALDGTEQAVEQAQARLEQQEDHIVDAALTEYNTAKARQASFQQQYNEQKAEALQLDSKGVEYAALQREAASNKTLFDNLLTRTKETNVSGQFKGSNISIIDAAEIPRAPFAPNTRRDLMLAFVEGCLLAFGLAIGFEYLDSRIKTPDELKQHLNLPFLGLVPAIDMAGRTGDDPMLLTGDLPPAFSEAMRAVRTSVIFSSADEGARAIVVTSTAPGEGKTLISTNLAIALAQADQRTLIIDGDMRRPRVHAAFHRPQEPGLSNVLVGTARMSDAVRMTQVPNLYVMTAGHIPPNPAELLGSTKYLEMLDEMRQQFDWIIIDAPPVMAVTDSAILSNSATGVVFVVGADMTAKRNAISAVEHLQAARAKFIGAVLNRVDLKRHSYYYAPYYRKDYAQAYHKAR
jgi:capsular exopolysaccharide synthesis family protein